MSSAEQSVQFHFSLSARKGRADGHSVRPHTGSGAATATATARNVCVGLGAGREGQQTCQARGSAHVGNGRQARTVEDHVLERYPRVCLDLAEVRLMSRRGAAT